MSRSVADPLLIQQAGAVIELILNRPDKANALDAGLVEALLVAVARAANSGARLLTLRGEGRHFCAGFDFSDLDQQSDGDLLHRFVRIEQLLQAAPCAADDARAVPRQRAGSWRRPRGRLRLADRGARNLVPDAGPALWHRARHPSLCRVGGGGCGA